MKSYIYTNGIKETVYCKSIDNSNNPQWMSMQIYKHSVPAQTFTGFHVRLLRHLYFLRKLLFVSFYVFLRSPKGCCCPISDDLSCSAAGKQHATKFNDTKHKFMQLMMRKPLYFC